MFNTLKYAKILEEVGFSRGQSEATIHILVDVMEDKLATKQDIEGLHQKMQQQALATAHDIEGLHKKMQQQALVTAHDIQGLHQKIDQQAALTSHEFQLVRQEMQQLKSDLVIKMGAMQAAAVGLVVALLKLL
jgi:hypothetical protein